jgi:hypothetical protein
MQDSCHLTTVTPRPVAGIALHFLTSTELNRVIAELVTSRREGSGVSEHGGTDTKCRGWEFPLFTSVPIS